MAKDHPLTVEVKDDELQIRIGIDTLKFALECAPEYPLCIFDEDRDEYMTYKVEDINQFVEDIVTELDNEQEDGTTPVHLLLDQAMLKAVENGSLGIAEEMSPSKL